MEKMRIFKKVICISLSFTLLFVSAFINSNAVFAKIPGGGIQVFVSLSKSPTGSGYSVVRGEPTNTDQLNNALILPRPNPTADDAAARALAEQLKKYYEMNESDYDAIHGYRIVSINRTDICDGLSFLFGDEDTVCLNKQNGKNCLDFSVLPAGQQVFYTIDPIISLFKINDSPSPIDMDNLKDAIDASDNGTIKLLCDYTIGTEENIDLSNVSLDLNGHSLKTSNKDNITLGDKYEFNGDEAPYSIDLKYYFQVGDTKYMTLSEAINAAKSSDDGTIKVLNDAKENNLDSLLISGVTLDLNGHNLTVNSMAGIGGIIKDSETTEKGSLTYINNFAYVNKSFEKKETNPGIYENPYAYIPVKVDDKKYQFYEASVANVNKSDLTGDYNGKRQAVVGSAIVEKIHDKVFTSDSGVGLGLRVGIDSNDKESYSFSASIIQQYTENATISKPYFKIVGLDNAASITINGFVTNDSVTYRYDGKAKTINLAEQLDSDPNSKGE